MESQQAQVHNLNSRINEEIKNREGIQDQLSSMQSQLEHLSRTIPHSLSPTQTVFTNTGNITSVQPPIFQPRPNAAVLNGPCPTPMIRPTAQLLPNYYPQYPAPAMPVSQQIISHQEIRMFQAQLSSLQERYSASEKNLNSMYDDVEDLKARMNDRDQYDRRNNGILHGLTDVPIMPRKPTQEDTKKFTKYVVDKLNELFPGIEGGISARDIDDTHIFRTRRNRPNSHAQLVIIRFCSRLLRNEIFSQKKLLKNTDCSLTEHLTKFNLELLKAAQKRVGNVKKVWTHYGKVLIDLNGTIKSIHNYDDLEYYTANY